MTTTQTADRQAAMSPDKALELLVEGNRRFRENRRIERDLLQQIEATREGQWPFAFVLSCIDSRAPAELLFDLGIGDVFVARVAGNLVNEDILGSMEFGCRIAGARLIVVMGHTHCGAVKGACDEVELGNLTSMLTKLRPAVASIAEPVDPSARTSANPAFVQAVAEANVELAITAIRKNSPVLRDLESRGDIGIVGAMYDVQSGAVQFQQ